MPGNLASNGQIVSSRCCCYTIYKLWRNPSQQVLAFGRCVPQHGCALADAGRLVGAPRHGQACAGTVDNTVSSGEITEATDDVHCRAATSALPSAKSPLVSTLMAGVGRAMLRPTTTLFSGASDECAISSENRWRHGRKYGRQRDLQVRKVGWRFTFPEELSLRVREENQGLNSTTV